MADARTYKVDEDDDGIRLDRWFKRHLAVLTSEGEALPMGSLSMTPAEFAAIVPPLKL